MTIGTSMFAAFGFGASIVTAVCFAAWPAPTVYALQAEAEAIPPDSRVDFGVVEVTDILAWTNGHGADVHFGQFVCNQGMNGDVDNHLLRSGDRVHLLGSVAGKIKRTLTFVYDCEIVGDKNP